MSEPIWIEVLSRHGDVASRTRFTCGEIRIGRGYDNDVILDDPFVAPHHLRIFRDGEGKLVAEDAGSANGVWLKGARAQGNRVVLDAEHPIRVGRTLLRAREASHSVHPEQVDKKPGFLLHAVIALLIFAILAIDALSTWFGEAGEPKITNYLIPPLLNGIIIGGWVCGAAILGRVLSGRARLERHLLVGLLGAFALTLYSEASPLLAYMLNWPALADDDYAVMSAIFAVTCFFQAREISKSHLIFKGAFIATALVVGIIVQSLKRSESFYDMGRKTAYQRLMPPSLRLSPAKNATSFFSDVEKLKEKIDGDRKSLQGRELR